MSLEIWIRNVYLCEFMRFCSQSIRGFFNRNECLLKLLNNLRQGGSTCQQTQQRNYFNGESYDKHGKNNC